MSTALQLRRGSTAQHASFTGAEGEVSVDTSKDTLVVHDGATAGGFPLAKESQLSGFRNAIINGNFGINQRGVSGTVSLAAGAYGHDRWKAGASGCTYTFATSENVTTITISAGSLIQVVEGLNLMTGTYSLSWQGTAQGKIGAGSYGNSGITGAVTGGTNLNIEFGTGTLSLVQLEKGSVATPFEFRSIGQELQLAQRYYETGRGFAGSRSGDNVCTASVNFKVTKRATPTMTWTAFNGSSPSPQYQAVDSAGWFASGGSGSSSSGVDYVAQIEL